ncbi:hypothetical protein OUZ56_013009 [Daphnia magna]|uniref:Uncharacterized protein n=1 Tax=Daphnia magna TaxID=35525 RepID=A0ABQ9Z4P1_9CRUS|nr:hypothetical protein OUZ56_013009 [Daphnia magna]
MLAGSFGVQFITDGVFATDAYTRLDSSCADMRPKRSASIPPESSISFWSLSTSGQEFVLGPLPLCTSLNCCGLIKYLYDINQVTSSDIY